MIPTVCRSRFSIRLSVILILVTGISFVGSSQLCAQINVGGSQAADTAGVRVWRDNPFGIPVTRWMDDQGRQPITYEEWKAKAGSPGPFEERLVAIRPALSDSREAGLFCVIVNSSLYPAIEADISQYTQDVAADGFSVSVHTTSGGTPENLRAFLQAKYAEGMVGAVLIGDFPVPWYEADCWDPITHEEFPCDLYYMDMDGVWQDLDVDGLYDTHSGNVAPEVWIGRMTPSPLTFNGASEISLLHNYFRKNHLYRTGQLVLADRALSFIDDDWEPYATEWSGNHGLAYPDRTTISDPYQTTAPNYSGQLPLNYESILLCAHSSPQTHWFKTPPENWTTIDYDEIVNIDPVAFFYNLFACSNARYVESNYMAGWYIFCPSYGLASVGSTKTGSMLTFDAFYSPFGNDATIGEAFADWFSFVASGGMEDWEICWHYGMTLCGDPTLRSDVYSPPTVITSSLPDGSFGIPYSFVLEAAGGQPPYKWRLVAGELPKDLALDTITGAITGIPNEAGAFAFTVCVGDDMVSCADSLPLQLTVTYICGNANGDEIINLADAVFLINYVFKSGPEPRPLDAGDANCDGAVNLADAVYLIGYVFSGGPPPCCP